MSDENEKEVEDVFAALGAEHRQTARMLETLNESDWLLPTRCEGWNVSDVVLHLAQTDELAVASLRNEFESSLADLGRASATAGDVDEGAAAMVELERGLDPEDLLERWKVATARLRDELEESDPSRRVQWVAGLLSVRTLATTRLAETWIHAGDVSSALSTEHLSAERLRHVARLAWRTLPYAFSRAGRTMKGPVAFDLRGPSGARWSFVPEEDGGEPATTVRGEGVELCLVAARRLEGSTSSLSAHGPDADAVLSLVRTYA